MQKLLKLLFVCFVVIGLFLLYRAFDSSDQGSGSAENRQKQKQKGQVYLKFTGLSKGVIAQSGDYQVLESEINKTAPMRTFRNKRREVLFALIYRQFVVESEKPITHLDLSFKKLSENYVNVLKRYGIPQKKNVKVEFQVFSESQGVARIDGLPIKKSQINFNNFIWASYETDLFRYKLSEVNKILKRKVIQGEAKKLKISVQQYKDKYIDQKIPKEVSEKDLLKYFEVYQMEDTERNRQTATHRLLQARKTRGMDYILEKYVMDLPIQINLKQPQHQLEAKLDWTPAKGKGEVVSMTLFSGTQNKITTKLISQLIPLLKTYPEVTFYYRPYFLKNNRWQEMTSQMHLCVWMNHKKDFWTYLMASLGKHRLNTENNLYQQAQELDFDVSVLKSCLEGQQYKEVLDYHLKYAEYLGIHSSPVLYIGGEVLHGVVTIEDVEDILTRQLKRPAAGVW